MTPYDAIQGVPNACQILPSITTGGQPSLQHVEALAAAGNAIVLDLREPMEPRPFSEPDTVSGLGMEYRNIPVGAYTLNDATLDAVRDALKQAGDRPVFVHCAAGARVGAALIPHLMLDHGFDEDDAVDAAMRVGLRSAEYLEWGLDYARRHARQHRPADAPGAS